MANDYRVISQRQTSIFTPGRKLVQVVEVEIEVLPIGVHRTVDIPVGEYNVNTAKAKLEELATETLAVHKLGQP